MQKAAANPTAQNLNTLPELLLLGVVFLSGKMGFGGEHRYIWSGSGENDHNIAQKAAENLGFNTQQ
nr:hypothetical protein [Riemerella anatipestifer]